jgi:prephenate dehydrogenase
LSASALQDQTQVIALHPGFGNRILRYDTAVVLHIDSQLRTGNHTVSQIQDFCQPVRSKPVIGVATNVRLQHKLFLFSG